MKITQVCCQGCGAALDVDESMHYITCNRCGSRLEVVHDSTVTHTRVLEQIEQNTDRLAEEVQMLKLQNDLERLDREWALYRDTAMVRGNHGRVSEPSVAGALWSGGAMTGFGIFMVTKLASSSGPAFLPFVGLLMIVGGIFIVIRGIAKATEFNTARATYEAKRRGMVENMDRFSGLPHDRGAWPEA